MEARMSRREAKCRRGASLSNQTKLEQKDSYRKLDQGSQVQKSHSNLLRDLLYELIDIWKDEKHVDKVTYWLDEHRHYKEPVARVEKEMDSSIPRINWRDYMNKWIIAP